jgi:hypothetical protein
MTAVLLALFYVNRDNHIFKFRDLKVTLLMVANLAMYMIGCVLFKIMVRKYSTIIHSSQGPCGGLQDGSSSVRLLVLVLTLNVPVALYCSTYKSMQVLFFYQWYASHMEILLIYIPTGSCRSAAKAAGGTLQHLKGIHRWRFVLDFRSFLGGLLFLALYSTACCVMAFTFSPILSNPHDRVFSTITCNWYSIPGVHCLRCLMSDHNRNSLNGPRY